MDKEHSMQYGHAVISARSNIHKIGFRELLALLLFFERLYASFELGVCRRSISNEIERIVECSENPPGMTSSIINGARLNGSFGSLSRCERMVERSKEVFDVGSMTGSSMIVNISGSFSVVSRSHGYGNQSCANLKTRPESPPDLPPPDHRSPSPFGTSSQVPSMLPTPPWT